MPGADNVGLLGNLQNTGSSIYEYVMPGADDKGLFSNLGGTLFGTKSASEVLTEAARNNPAIDQAIQEGMARGLSFEQILAELQQKGMVGQQGLMGALQQYQQMTQGGQQGPTVYATTRRWRLRSDVDAWSWRSRRNGRYGNRRIARHGWFGWLGR